MNTTQNNTTKVFKNGNSRAIRLPRYALRSAEPGDVLVVEYLDDKVILHSKVHPRAGWDARFRDALLGGDPATISDKHGILNNDSTIRDGLKNLGDKWGESGE